MEEMNKLRKDIMVSFKSIIDNLIASDFNNIRKDLVEIKKSMSFLNEKFY